MPRIKSRANNLIHFKSVLIAVAIFLFYLSIISVNDLLKNVVNNTTATKENISVAEYFLGRPKPTTTLILFTNNAEMRYGGGFIGSVGLIRADGGKINVDPIRSVYYYDHRLDGKPAVDKMPPEFKNIAEDMRLRDSGIYLDWAEDAKNAARYFQLESGIKPDNVMAVTPMVLKEILKKTGPIELKSYGLTITADNILQTLQLEVESGSDKQAGDDPKTILGVLGNEILALLSRQSLSELAGYADILSPMFEQKQLMLYAGDLEVQKKLQKLSATGELAKFDGNYLLLAEENVGANKSSPYVEQTIDQVVTINDAGEAVVDLKLTRTHTSDYQHKYLDPHLGRERWLVAENINYAKLALSRGSQLIDYDKSIGDIKQSEESGRAVVAFWFSTAPKQSKTISLRYKLPYSYKMDRRLVVNSLFEKQTGAVWQKINQRVVVPANYRLVAASTPHVVYNVSNMTTVSEATTNKNHLTSFIYER